VKIIGLTGGIGMGKSTVAAMFADHHIPVFNADEAVHKAQAPGGEALPAIEAAFPGTVRDGVLDRDRLRGLVLGDGAAMKRLEAMMHPLVRARQEAFLAEARALHAKAALLDIPLLFETGNQAGFDAIITVSCPRAVQIERVKARGLPLAQIEAMIAKQMDDAEKRRRATHVIETAGSLEETRRQVEGVMMALQLA
jgi:dephospho-CoA kinase